jgi:60 kDa SS-A/Ro ribonucleoprotein
MGIDAKGAVLGMTATGFTIADPKDRGMMDFVGFDTAAPALLNDFARGEI